MIKDFDTFIFESMSFDEKIEKWWNTTKTAPQFIIRKTNVEINGREEIIGKPYIYKVKFLGIGANRYDEYDEIIYIGASGYEGVVNLKDKKELSSFNDTSWEPIAIFNDWTNSHGAQVILKSWGEIKAFVNDRNWEGTLPVYKGPQPK